MAALHSKVFQASGPHGLPSTTAWNQCNVLPTRWHLKRCSKGHAVPSASSSKSVELELAALRADLRELRQILESPLQTAVQAESDLAKENGAIFSGPTPSTQRDTLATAISQAREHISSPSSVDMLAKNLESVTAHLAEATLVATGSGTRNEAHTGKTSPSKRGRGRPRKTSSSVQEQGKDLEYGLPALIADSCTAFASLPDTFAHPAHFARALFALGKLSWQAVQLMAVLSAGTPQQGPEASVGIKASLLAGLQALMASAPEGMLQGSVGAATPQRQALIERTGGHDKIRSDDTALAGARSLGWQLGEEGKNLDAATVQCVTQMVAALEEREGPSGIAFCQAAWELILPGIQSFWSLEHQMDGAAAFLQHMASARRADGAASCSSSSPGSTSSNALVSIPTSITCPSPMGNPSGDRNTSKSTGSPTNDGPGVAEQGRLASANQPRVPRTLSPAFSSLLPAGILQDLSPEARALWLRVCCDTFAAPVHRLKAERARALAAQYTLQPLITAMHRSDLSCTSHPSSDKTSTMQDTRNAPAQTSSSGGSSSSSGSTPAAAAMVSFPDGAATPFQDGATASFPDGLAARRLVLAAAAFNRCCRAGMRHKDCFVVTQAWVDAVVAPALRSLSRPVVASNTAVHAQLAYMAASSLGLAAHSSSSSGSSSSSSISGGHPIHSGLAPQHSSIHTCPTSIDSDSGLPSSSSSSSSSSSGRAVPVASPAQKEQGGVVSLMELQALLGALRELQGSSSWTVPPDALESLDAVLTAEGACCLHGSKAATPEATPNTHLLPPRPTAPPAHMLASSSGMLQYVFAVEPLQEQQQQQEQQQVDDHPRKAQAAGPQAGAINVLPFALHSQPGSGDPKATAVGAVDAADAATAADVDRATSILELLKARSSLGRGSRFPLSASLLATASGAVMEAADRVTNTRTSAISRAVFRSNSDEKAELANFTDAKSSGSSSSSSNGGNAGQLFAVLPELRSPEASTELRMVTALQDLLSLLADQLQLCEGQQQQVFDEQGMHHTQPDAQQQQQQQQQQQLSALAARTDAVANKLFLLLAFLPDEAWWDAGFLTRTFPKLLQLCVGQLGQRPDLLQPERWVSATLSLLLKAPSPALNVDAYIRLARGARTLPAYLLLDPFAEHHPAHDKSSAHEQTWWSALDSAVAATVGSAATIAFLRPHRWLKLLRILTEVVDRDTAAPETASAAHAPQSAPTTWQPSEVVPRVEFPATAHAVGIAAASNPALFGGFGRRKHYRGFFQEVEEAPLFGGAANLNGEVGALLPRLCVRRAELTGVNGLDWLQAQTGLRG